MIGTTRSRVSFFMNRFRKLGFIDYDGRIRVHKSLLNVVLLDQLPESTRMVRPLPSAKRPRSGSFPACNGARTGESKDRSNQAQAAASVDLNRLIQRTRNPAPIRSKQLAGAANPTHRRNPHARNPRTA